MQRFAPVCRAGRFRKNTGGLQQKERQGVYVLAAIFCLPLALLCAPFLELFPPVPAGGGVCVLFLLSWAGCPGQFIPLGKHSGPGGHLHRPAGRKPQHHCANSRSVAAPGRGCCSGGTAVRFPYSRPAAPFAPDCIFAAGPASIDIKAAGDKGGRRRYKCQICLLWRAVRLHFQKAWHKAGGGCAANPQRTLPACRESGTVLPLQACLRLILLRLCHSAPLLYWGLFLQVSQPGCWQAGASSRGRDAAAPLLKQQTKEEPPSQWAVPLLYACVYYSFLYISKKGAAPLSSVSLVGGEGSVLEIFIDNLILFQRYFLSILVRNTQRDHFICANCCVCNDFTWVICPFKPNFIAKYEKKE